MTATDELTGIYLVAVRLADGRALEYAGTDDEANDWLDELRSVETVLDLDMHEMTNAEVDAGGQAFDGPCSDGEESA